MTLFAHNSTVTEEETRKKFQAEKDYRLRERYQVIYLSYQGYTCEEIAKICVREINTIRWWINDFNAEGYSGLRMDKSSGRPPKLTAEQQAELKKNS